MGFCKNCILYAVDIAIDYVKNIVRHESKPFVI